MGGELEWNYQKEAAKEAIKNLLGVIGVSNNITIRPETQDMIENNNIQSALRRNWSTRDCDIIVKVSDNKVTLTGRVNSWYQKTEAARIAWNAPGVWTVDNELVVEYD